MIPDTGDRKPESSKKGLEFKDRLFDFALRCVQLARTLPLRDAAAQILGRQLIRSATSSSANYRSAKRGRSNADFLSRMGIVEEECDESLHWIEMLVALKLVKQAKVDALLREGNELLSITVASIKTAKSNAKIK